MTLTILYFAWLRERAGLAEEVVTPPDSVVTVADLITWLSARSLRHAAVFADAQVIRCAVNQDFAAPGTELHAGDEVAFFPPVTGG